MIRGKHWSLWGFSLHAVPMLPPLCCVCCCCFYTVLCVGVVQTQSFVLVKCASSLTCWILVYSAVGFSTEMQVFNAASDDFPEVNWAHSWDEFAVFWCGHVEWTHDFCHLYLTMKKGKAFENARCMVRLWFGDRFCNGKWYLGTELNFNVTKSRLLWLCKIWGSGVMILAISVH